MTFSPNNPMQDAHRAICGAKTRRGIPCKTSPMKNGRCRMHGGTSTGAPKGNKNAFKHGRYSAESKQARAHTARMVAAFKDFKAAF